MKIKIKFMVTFMALVLSIFTAISVCAASEDPYQTVIDKDVYKRQVGGGLLL